MAVKLKAPLNKKEIQAEQEEEEEVNEKKQQKDSVTFLGWSSFCLLLWTTSWFLRQLTIDCVYVIPNVIDMER